MRLEKAAIGLLITLEEPTSGMKEIAIHAGSYVSAIWDKFYLVSRYARLSTYSVQGNMYHPD